MPEYIERDLFLDSKRHLYCENCARRKNGNGKIVYAIGDAPCRACGIGDVLDDVEDFPAADVRPVVRGKWTSVFDIGTVCNQCGYDIEEHGYDVRTDGEPNFCPNCGAWMEES